MRQFGETRRGWLGVGIQEVSEDIRLSLGLPSTEGALVIDVMKGGPAEHRIEPGDIVLGFDGKPVRTLRDLPRLCESLSVPARIALLKGRGSYLCLHRLDQLRAHPAAPMDFISDIDEWRRATETGDRAELTELAEDSSLWHDVSAIAETCLGSDCPQYRECYVTRMRQKAAESDVVIVNHHLLCADASVRQSTYGEVIPDCHYAIIDEAHHLEDVATQYFANYAVIAWVDEVEVVRGDKYG